MSRLLGLCGLTVVLMAIQDVLSTSLVVSESRGLGRWAGLFDAAGDFASKYGAAVTAYSVFAWGLWSWQTLVLVSVTALTSFVATSTATKWSNRLLPQAAVSCCRKDPKCVSNSD